MTSWSFGEAGEAVLHGAFSTCLRYSTRAPRQALARTPACAIRDVKERTRARVSGVLHYAENTPLLAPVSGRACAAWRVRAWWVDRQYWSWKELLDEHHAHVFYLDDRDARAVVDGAKLELLLHPDFREEVGGGSVEPRESLLGFLRGRSLAPDDLHSRCAYVVQEGVLEHGERVTVLGSGAWETDSRRAGHGYRDVARRFRMGPCDDGAFIASDEANLAADVAVGSAGAASV